MNTLKPCPFCGGEAKTLVAYDRVGGDAFVISTYVTCGSCGISKRRSADMKNASFEEWEITFEKTIADWNVRA